MTDDAINLCVWLLLHPGAREHRAPGWYWKFDDFAETGGPFWTIHCRHVDGREFDFSLGLYTRETTGTPLNMSFDYSVSRELHERYPDEYPVAVLPPTDYLSWKPALHIDEALEALVGKDMKRYEQAIKNAAKAMGVEVKEKKQADKAA